MSNMLQRKHAAYVLHTRTTWPVGVLVVTDVVRTIETVDRANGPTPFFVRICAEDAKSSTRAAFLLWVRRVEFSTTKTSPF